MLKPGIIVLLIDPAFEHLMTTGIVLTLKKYKTSNEYVLTLLTEKMTLLNIHQCYVRPYTGSVS
jgi:hypothetical protein